MVERMNSSSGNDSCRRSFTSPNDFNDQLEGWLPIANARVSRSRRGRPADLIGRDRAAMRALSPVSPVTVPQHGPAAAGLLRPGVHE